MINTRIVKEFFETTVTRSHFILASSIKTSYNEVDVM